MFKAEAYALSILIATFSGAWAYLKLVLMLGWVLLPAEALSIRTRCSAPWPLLLLLWSGGRALPVASVAADTGGMRRLPQGESHACSGRAGQVVAHRHVRPGADDGGVPLRAVPAPGPGAAAAARPPQCGLHH
eukprot:scaffold5178_cov364-Prasinococcus_capsulatus_cf.AAC.18